MGKKQAGHGLLLEEWSERAIHCLRFHLRILNIYICTVKLCCLNFGMTSVIFFESMNFLDLVVVIGVRISKTHELESYGLGMQ